MLILLVWYHNILIFETSLFKVFFYGRLHLKRIRFTFPLSVSGTFSSPFLDCFRELPFTISLTVSGVTVLLSLTVFQESISDSMPITSLQIPLLGNLRFRNQAQPFGPKIFVQGKSFVALKP